jgi:class 3 adenylate cyclase
MSAAARTDLTAYRALLDEVVTGTLRRGSLAATVLGLLSGVLLLVAASATGRAAMFLPTAWTFFCGAYSCVVWLLARAGRARGGVLTAVMLGFASLPSTIYVAAAFTLPSGAATYLTGPPSYLYFFVVAVSGVALNPRLSAICGLVAGAEYAALVLVDFEHLSALTGPDPLLVEDVTSVPFYFFKSLMMAFTGLVTGVAAANARRLVGRVMEEAEEKRAINRLFGEFVSPQVREKIIGEKAGSKGEKLHVAVLFSDLRSFTSFSERHDPEEVVERLNQYFDEMVAAIAAEGGVVDKFIGDAIMGVFGGVIPLENPAEAAFRAARGMRRRLRRLNEAWAAAGLEPLESGIGIHYGVVLQGTIGSRDRKEFTVVGDSVNTAARVEGLCKDFAPRVLFTEAFRDRLGPEAQRACTFLGTATVKGKTSEIRLWGAADEV